MNLKSVHNLMVRGSKLTKDEDDNGKGVDKTLYRQMVRSVMYATTTR